MVSVKDIQERFQRWNRNRMRLPQIAGALPEAIDLLVLVMRAGLDFQVALGQYLARGPDGPLREELALMQAEIRTGTARIEALRRLAQRVPEPSLQETVRAIIQGIELGSSLTP